ncbi:hypothetical protein [Nonomuraea sediminis]|uniref:hypothetical protein n=1 Tax=Nonomuraea sediminis TaxID=2835864 RepID=UPI001BDC9065|nr:hypothetical protein [Nonomuraea sediminis]
MSLLVLAAAVFVGIIAAAADPAAAGRTFLALGAGCGLLAALSVATGHKQAAWLGGLAALAFLCVGAIAVFGT